MGFDITYHPLAEEEVRTLWFDLLTSPAALSAVQARVADDEGAGEYIANLVEEAAGADPAGDVNVTHLFPLAIVAGIVRPYWYLRGGAFSFCVEKAPALEEYLAPWSALVPEPWRQGQLSDLLASNETVGCYLPAAQVGRLAADIRAGALPAEALDVAFSHGRLDIFLRALDDAAEQKRGLLEAADVAVPDPFGGWNQCLTRADHCHEEGIVLYAEAAEAQLAAAETKKPKRR